jgi:putative multiple sugar transport system ATP-binding protein
MSTPILEMKNITKTFPGVRALSDVTFSVAPSEIHCLVGENGAGKSTLMKVLSGVHPFGEYTGDIVFDGKTQVFHGIADSEKAGIAIIYQELALVPEMTVYENIFLGHEIRRGITVNWNETIKQATEMLGKVRLDVSPDTLVKDLGVGKQQLVEIAKAMSRNVKLLVLDEPTAALNENDCDNLFAILRELKGQGVTCVLITHKLREVIKVADMVTVLRDGQTICTLDARKGEVSEAVLIKNMVGREIDNVYPPRTNVVVDEEVLRVKGWTAFNLKSGRTVLQDVSFSVRKGEIVGFAGLMGSGRTELARSIFGNPDGYRVTGELFVHGVSVHYHHPHDAIEDGVAYATEDRKANGLILIQDVKQNITLANLKEISRRGIMDDNAEVKAADTYKTALTIRTPSLEQKVYNLSGGNQQKVSVAKWLFVKPQVLILDEPTRGIDVGAKYEIYQIMNRLASEGISIIMISSELPEVLGMSDRVYVISSGKITGELPVKEATQEIIMELATR